MGRTSNAKIQLLNAMVDLMWERSYGSLTIDVICERAEVKKGSFYHFFPSKLHLAIAAMDHIWLGCQPKIDAVFSPSLPPLVRLSTVLDKAYSITKKIAETHGKVLGCPYFTIGAETSTIEPELVEKVNQILSRYQRYFESSIVEAIGKNDLPKIDATEASRICFNLYEGMITQARLKNNPDILKDLPTAIARVLCIEALPSPANVDVD
ncbi:MAG: TetR/AcrR family transcriptional regulator [Akkermansiaceae bacterium]